jgi:shikimate kinase
MQIEKKRMSELDLYKLVVAPGGSLVYHDDLMQSLKQKAVIVYLDESLANLEKRLSDASTRGIIGLKGKSLAEIFAERSPLYMRYADIVINSDNLTCPQITREILRQLRAFEVAKL